MRAILLSEAPAAPAHSAKPRSAVPPMRQRTARILSLPEGDGVAARRGAGRSFAQRSLERTHIECNMRLDMITWDGRGSEEARVADVTERESKTGARPHRPYAGETPAVPAAPLYEVIYRTLREHIAERRFPEGLIIGEAAVARAFRSSRIPAGIALRRLQDDGLLQNFDGRGFLAARAAGAAPLRLGLAEAGLRLPDALRSDLDIRNQRKRIYARVEHQIACCLPYGRFQVNESVLAATYGVS